MPVQIPVDYFILFFVLTFFILILTETLALCIVIECTPLESVPVRNTGPRYRSAIFCMAIIVRLAGVVLVSW